MSNANSTVVNGRDCPLFRVSYPAVFEARGFNEGEPKFAITMLFEKSAALKASPLWKAAITAGTEKFGEKFKVVNNTWPKGFRSPFRDGDEDKPDAPEYEGKIFVRASSRADKPPLVVDQNLQVLTKENGGEEAFYSGCYAKAMVTAFAYDVNGNKGVSFALIGVQKVKDGERLGGTSRAMVANSFDSVASPSGEDDESF